MLEITAPFYNSFKTMFLLKQRLQAIEATEAYTNILHQLAVMQQSHPYVFYLCRDRFYSELR